MLILLSIPNIINSQIYIFSKVLKFLKKRYRRKSQRYLLIQDFMFMKIFRVLKISSTIIRFYILYTTCEAIQH
jgi:hypothetical protein